MFNYTHMHIEMFKVQIFVSWMKFKFNPPVGVIRADTKFHFHRISRELHASSGERR